MPKTLLLFAFFFISAVCLRIALYINFEKSKPLQLLGPVTLVTKLAEGSKQTEKGQVLKVQNLRVYPEGLEKYYAGDTVQISGMVDEKGRIFRPQITKTGEGSKISKLITQARDTISANIGKALPRNEAALVNGMVLGVDELSYNLKQNLIKTGTIHTVVVSGQNLSIVAGFVLGLSRLIGRKRAVFLSITAVIFYSVLTGFEPPVVRATIMVIAASIAYYFGREIWPLWGLVFSAFFILLLWPQALFEISFQLTFAATLGIMTLGKAIERVARVPQVSRLPHAFAKSRGTRGTLIVRYTFPWFGSTITGINELLITNTSIALSAYLFTAPILLWYFGTVSFSAPLVNILVAQAVVPVMIIGFIMAFSSLIFLPLTQIIGLFAYIPAYYFLKVVEIFSGL